MKKMILALSTLGALADAVHAQNNVTLYGIVDAGLTYVSNEGGNKNFKQTHGNLQGSRWGLKGAEDLGGGMKAIFVLENGFSLGNGSLDQGGRMFGRQAYAGLSSATAGTFTIGRQYDSVVDFVGPFASVNQWATSAGAHPFDNDNLNNRFWINNSVKYTTANYAGFSASALYGFSNQANNGNDTGFANNRAWSVGLGYANGPLSLGAGYVYLGRPGSTTDGAVTEHSAFIDNTQIYALGGSYAFGPATVGLVYSQTKNENIRGTRIKFDNVELNSKYMLTPALQLGAAYTYTWYKADRTDGTSDKLKFHQINLGMDYFLSKRTDTYLVGLYHKASGDEYVVAQLNGFSASKSKNQFAVTAGIRHKF